MELHASFNTLDYIVFGIILISGLLAIFTGFVREVYSLFNWAASYFVAVRFYPYAEPYVAKYISKHETVVDASIFLIFCGTFIVLAIIGMVVTNLILRGAALTAIDRSLGFVFGLVRGILITCLIYLVASSVLWPDIDAPPKAAANIDEPIYMMDAKDKSEKRSLTMAAPHWLVDARTRPLLAHGADMLREFIPEKVLEKTTEDILDKKQAVEDKFEQESNKYISPADRTPTTNDRP